ncbi:MAG: LuxR C-terminal-related transcriptional regulator [Phycisphaerae bacterium]|nr:LuxR C-terminal-related transcriptional regulator [Phycisphaerae bacterium]
MTLVSEELCIFDRDEWEILIEELALSPRQSQIVRHLFLGQSDKQIAQAMELALPTVRTHLGRIFAKFNVQDRHELILYVFHHFRSACRSVNCPLQSLHHNGQFAETDVNKDTDIKPAK